MTKEQLDGIHWLPKEIKYLDTELRKLPTPPPDPKRASAFMLACMDLREVLQLRRDAAKKQYDAGIAFIDGISDDLTRFIFKKRFLEAKSWLTINFEIQDMGYNYADGSVKKICSRYLEKEETRCNSYADGPTGKI